MASVVDNLVSAWNLGWASVISEQTWECVTELSKDGILLYNSTNNRITQSPAELQNVKIPKYLIPTNPLNLIPTDPINYCKISFKANGLNHYYDYNELVKPKSISIHSGKITDTYSIGTTYKFTKDANGNLTPINGCKYIFANFKSDTQNAIDLSAFQVYEIHDLQIDTIMMNNTLSKAIKIPNTTPEYLVCLYDFAEKPQSNMFVFKAKYERALKCFNKLEENHYKVWDTHQNKAATPRDIKLINIDCNLECATSMGDSYVEWCKNALKDKGFHSFYEFSSFTRTPLKIKAGKETDTFSVGIAEHRGKEVEKVSGCKYVIAGFKKEIEGQIDLSGLKVKFKDLSTQTIYMNNLPTKAIQIHKIEPEYLFCFLDYHDELVADNFIFT